jgi:cell wall-associated NlpC family hydrolase
MNELAWAYGTPKKYYDYKKGAPKKVCKLAMKDYGWADSRAELSDCGNFVSTVVRKSGVSKSFKALHGIKTPFPKKEAGFSIVLSGKKIPKGFLKPGDIIRYKKKNGKQHAMFYYGNGKICEASHHTRFGVILKDTKKYNKVSKVNTIQVLRAK